MRDKRIEPSVPLLSVLSVVSFIGAYFSASAIVEIPAVRLVIEEDGYGGNLSNGVLLLYFTGLFFSALARSSMRISFWTSGWWAVGATVVGIWIMIFAIFVTLSILLVSDGVLFPILLFAVPYALTLMALPVVFSFVTFLGALLGYSTVELIGQWLLRGGAGTETGPGQGL